MPPPGHLFERLLIVDFVSENNTQVCMVLVVEEQQRPVLGRLRRSVIPDAFVREANRGFPQRWIVVSNGIFLFVVQLVIDAPKNQRKVRSESN